MGQLSDLFTDEEEALLIRNMRKRLIELAITMAEKLGRFMPNFMYKQKFVDKERQYAYEYWNKHKE